MNRIDVHGTSIAWGVHVSAGLVINVLELYIVAIWSHYSNIRYWEKPRKVLVKTADLPADALQLS
jgi:hypothetical protein